MIYKLYEFEDLDGFTKGELLKKERKEFIDSNDISLMDIKIGYLNIYTIYLERKFV